MLKVVMHNSVSLDGAILGFDINMELHYRIAGRYAADVQLVGSNTIKAGIEMFGVEIPPEEESDFTRPEKDAGLPYWVVPDARGVLKGILHYLRREEFCKDIVVLVSEKTERDYLQYLEERDCDYYICGEDYVNYEKAFGIIQDELGAGTVFIDAGPTLNGILLEKGLIDEISLLVHPFMVGKKSGKLFERLELENKNIELEPMTCELLDGKYLHLNYRVVK